MILRQVSIHLGILANMPTGLVWSG